jgi:hypothetical protein
MNKEDFVRELSKLRSSATFLTVKGYSSENSEVSDFSIVFNMSYKNALEKSLMALESYVPADELEAQAKTELMESYSKSLNKINSTPLETVDDGYERFYDENNQVIKGVKLHKATDTLHLFGLLVHKRVIMPGNYKKVNHKSLTIIKNKLKKMCVVEKFRQFRIDSNVESINVNHISLLPPESE